MRISDWSSDVCSSDLAGTQRAQDRGQIVRNAGLPLSDLAPQATTIGDAGGLHVLESDTQAGMVGADGPAQKDVALEYPNLAYVARIVADRHRLADMRGESRVEVPQPLLPDGVAEGDAASGQQSAN